MLRIIRKSEYRTMPWKNGGGTATDIIVFPEGAGYDTFDWRLSGAHVGRDGPFSLFPDIDRTMAILNGEALTLHGVPGGPNGQNGQNGAHGDMTLTPQSLPYAFPGDIPVTATLAAGPVDNLNMMSLRGRYRHSMRRITATQTITPDKGTTLLIFAERGTAQLIAGETTVVLGPHDTAITSQKLMISLPPSSGGQAQLIVIEVRKV